MLVFKLHFFWTIHAVVGKGNSGLWVHKIIKSISELSVGVFFSNLFTADTAKVKVDSFSSQIYLFFIPTFFSNFSKS